MDLYTRKIIENNYGGGINSLGKDKIHEEFYKEISKMTENEDTDVDNIKTLTSILKGAPVSEKTVNLICSLFCHIVFREIRKEFLEELVELFLMLYIKCDETTKDEFYDDITQFFKDERNVQTRQDF